MTGKVPKELEELTELPKVFTECWMWFLALNRTRQASMGISAISYTEMQAFFYFKGIVPESYEVDMISTFDSIACRVSREQQEKSSNSNNNNNKDRTD